MKNKWKALSVTLGLVLVALVTIGARHEEQTITKLLVKEIRALNSTVGLTIYSPTIDTGIAGTGVISADNIADVTRRIPVPLGSVFVDASGPITDSTAPNLATVDNVGAIVYDDSSETAEIQFDWYPDTHFTAMAVKMICTSSNATGTDNAVDWSIFVHGNDLDIPSATAQTGATLTSTTLDVSEELVTLTLDATGIAAVTAGTTPVTVAVWNNSTDNYTLEIKKLWLEEARDQ